MENNKENFKKLVAQYWGQDVLYFQGQTWNVFEDFDDIIDNNKDVYLLLTPLHLISDEDSIKLFNHVYPNHLPMDNDEKIESIKEVFEDFRGYRFLDLKTSTRFIDKVREMSYAVDFNGLSVEEQVNRNWVVLKTKI